MSKSGLIFETNEAYHSGPGYSSSQLKAALETGASNIDKPRPEPSQSLQDAMDCGSLVHSLVLEPEQVSDQFMCLPPHIARRRGEIWEEFQRAHAGKTILTTARWHRAHRTAEAILANGEALELLRLPRVVPPETSYYWIYRGVLLKVRWDQLARVAEQPLQVDIKTFSGIRGLTDENASELLADRSASLGYHVSLAHYAHGAKHLLGRWPSDTVIVWAETREPYRVYVRRVPDRTLAVGAESLSGLLHQLAERVVPAPAAIKPKFMDLAECSRRALLPWQWGET